MFNQIRRSLFDNPYADPQDPMNAPASPIMPDQTAPVSRPNFGGILDKIGQNNSGGDAVSNGGPFNANSTTFNPVHQTGSGGGGGGGSLNKPTPQAVTPTTATTAPVNPTDPNNVAGYGQQPNRFAGIARRLLGMGMGGGRF